jgi:hypothetical protein
MPGYDPDVQTAAERAPREVKYTAASSIETPTSGAGVELCVEALIRP